MLYPALDVDGVDDEFLLALVDDFSPPPPINRHLVTVLFRDRAIRDRAREAIARARPEASSALAMSMMKTGRGGLRKTSSRSQ